MKLAKKTPFSLLSGILVLLASLAITLSPASAGTEVGNSNLYNPDSEKELYDQLSQYLAEDDVEQIQNIKVKIYGANDILVFSAEVCQKEYECDERLNNFINQSDFITEVDNTRIYILNQ